MRKIIIFGNSKYSKVLTFATNVTHHSAFVDMPFLVLLVRWLRDECLAANAAFEQGRRVFLLLVIPKASLAVEQHPALPTFYGILTNSSLVDVQMTGEAFFPVKCCAAVRTHERRLLRLGRDTFGVHWRRRW